MRGHAGVLDYPWSLYQTAITVANEHVKRQ